MSEPIRLRKTDSVILAWRYEMDGSGILVMGTKDPRKIDDTMKIVGAWPGIDGVKVLDKLGISIGF